MGCMDICINAGMDVFKLVRMFVKSEVLSCSLCLKVAFKGLGLGVPSSLLVRHAKAYRVHEPVCSELARINRVGSEFVDVVPGVLDKP